MTSLAQYIAASLPAEGFVGIDLLINIPPRGDRPGRIGVLGVGKTEYYKLRKAGTLPEPIRIGTKPLHRVEDVRHAIAVLAQPVETVTPGIQPSNYRKAAMASAAARQAKRGSSSAAAHA